MRKMTSKEERVIWDEAVPVVKSGFHTDAYICDGIGEPFIYAELCHILRKAEQGETVTLHINTPGGMIDSAFMLIDAIKTSKAGVTAHLTGTVASAGTMISLACDKLVVADHTSFMIHNYSAGMMGKGHEMKARQEFTDKSLNEAFKEFYRGFLSNDEMEEVIDGKDMWMGKKEVLERWNSRVDLLSGKTIDKLLAVVSEDEE